ncbi:MAG: nucleoside phosphorylase [Clostridia bacterium]|nr:nucleoside phosphorylase [Clostridia bacterium]
MTLIKNEIPILEYDDDPQAIIAPDHEGFDIRLPERAVFPFLSDTVDAYAKKVGAKAVATFESATKKYPVYVFPYRGRDICLAQAPVGSAPAAQILDWLIGYGVRKVISAGCCGTLDAFDENVFLVPTRALRDEGTSYHYAPPTRFIDLSPTALAAIERTFNEHGLPFRKVLTWTTDGFFRETKEKVAYRRQEGCSVVEMECAALAACARFRGADFGQILYTGDTLADPDSYDMRSFGISSRDLALSLCLDAVTKL